MKKKSRKYLILAVILTAAFCGLTAWTVTARDLYTPENKVEEMNYKRSQVYVDGTGYKLDEYKKEQHKKEEVKHEKVVREDPVKRYVPQAKPTQRKVTQPEPEKPKKEKPKKKQKKKPKKKPEKQEDEPEKKKVSENPVITISIKNGEKVTGAVKKFTVKASSYDGDPIPASGITVKMNGVRLLENGTDTYIGDVKDGENVITVAAVDSENRKSELKRTFTGTINAPPKVIGKLNVSVTADVLGIKTVVPKKSVKIYENEMLSDVVKRYFDESPGVTGVEVGSGYYELGYIKKKGIINEIPDKIVEELEEAGIELPDDRDSLGLNDFGAGSGWMYSVNGTSPNQYMSKMDPVVGSNVVIYYTTSAM